MRPGQVNHSFTPPPLWRSLQSNELREQAPRLWVRAPKPVDPPGSTPMGFQPCLALSSCVSSLLPSRAGKQTLTSATTQIASFCYMRPWLAPTIPLPTMASPSPPSRTLSLDLARLWRPLARWFASAMSPNTSRIQILPDELFSYPRLPRRLSCCKLKETCPRGELISSTLMAVQDVRP